MIGSRGGIRFAAIATLTMAPLLLVLSTGCPTLPVPDGNTNDNTSGNTNDNTSGNTNENTSGPRGNSGLTGKFVGSERCALCHQNQHTDWSATLHAKAYETLEAIGQQNNAQCVGCHSVGFGEPGGFVDRATTDALAGVGCESCHGPGGDHANNVNDESLRPQISISSDVCAKCHTGEHHPNFEDWAMSKHASVEPELVPRFAAGSSLSSCGVCHSGDYFYHKVILGETVPDTLLSGKTSEQMAGITCAICHDPHKRTGNAATPEDGRDYQLRFEQIKFTEPSTSVADATNPARFNLCGQCHHARDRVWTDSSREPHPSDQVNVFFGEMPVPANTPPIVAPRASVHLNVAEQCSTCHVFRKPIVEGIAPAVSGHTFEVNFESCAECHGSKEAAEAKIAGLEAEIDYRVDLLLDALDEWASTNDIDGKGLLSWEYTSEGGPNSAGQARIPDNIKKARYIYYYVIAGGGNGVHNPGFVRDALIQALEYAETAPAALP